MPRIPAAVAVVVLVAFSIGFNIFRYEAVWEMLNAPTTLTQPTDSTPSATQPLRTASEKAVPQVPRPAASPAVPPNPSRTVMPPAASHPPAATETAPPAKPGNWPAPTPKAPANRPERPRDPMEQPIDASPATKFAMTSNAKPTTPAKPGKKGVSAYKPTAPATAPNTTPVGGDPFTKSSSASAGTALSTRPSEGFGAGSTACPTTSRPEYHQPGSLASRSADAPGRPAPQSSRVHHLPPVSEVVQVYPDDHNWRQPPGTIPMYPTTPYPANPIRSVRR